LSEEWYPEESLLWRNLDHFPLWRQAPVIKMGTCLRVEDVRGKSSPVPEHRYASSKSKGQLSTRGSVYRCCCLSVVAPWLWPLTSQALQVWLASERHCRWKHGSCYDVCRRDVAGGAVAGGTVAPIYWYQYKVHAGT
jgi:hypothetical protein